MENIDKERDPAVESESFLRPHYKHKGLAERMWKQHRIQFTEDYKYINKNIFLQILYFITDLFVMPFIYLFMYSTWGFQVEGKKNLKSVRRRAAVSVSNHVHNADALMVTRAFWPRTPYMVARPHNLEAVFVGSFNRIMRAVALPADMTNFRYFCQAINRELETTHHKVHIYPEGEIQHHGANLRRFKTGAFHFAVINDVPVVPMVFVFPSRHKVKLLIGKPIELNDVPDYQDLNESKRVRAVSNYTRDVMQKMIDNYYRGRDYDPRNEDN